mmetsp:Transcript_72882/g.170714  ORF Transcript_72882/g.170714 Transcript_72882/m.170714 type:complete len:308 (-) Transcript_72882:30-953(-)
MGRRPGAFSAALSQEERESRDELLALRGHLPSSQPKVTEIEQELHQDILDEAGFVHDEQNPLVYVSSEEARRTDGVPHLVVHRKVALRKFPSTDANVLGVCEAGEQLTLFDLDTSGMWRKLHFKLKGGYGSIVEAWVMLRHEKLGWLVKKVGADPCPEATIKAAAQEAPGEPLPEASEDRPEEEDHTARVAALAAEFGERLCLMFAKDLRRFMPTDSRRRFEVVRKPVLAVRSLPSKDALIVTTAEFGQIVDTFGVDETGEWHKVYCRCTSSGREDAPLPDNPLPAWMLEKHESLGILLRPVEDAIG